MDQILGRPEIQSAVAPFLISLALFLGLRKSTDRAWIWALLAAFLISAGLINGFTPSPLTGTRKIVLLVLMAALLAGLAPTIFPATRLRHVVGAAFAALAYFWVFGKVVWRFELLPMALSIGGGLGLIYWLLWCFERLRDRPAQFHAAGFGLLLGSGLAATAAASALLGQLALSLSASAGAVLLGWVLKDQPKTVDHGAALPYALAAALLGLAAVIFARLPWYALAPLASIPLLAGFVPKVSETRFTQALVSSLPGLTIGLATAFWVWQAGSSSSGY